MLGIEPQDPLNAARTAFWTVLRSKIRRKKKVAIEAIHFSFYFYLSITNSDFRRLFVASFLVDG